MHEPVPPGHFRERAESPFVEQCLDLGAELLKSGKSVRHYSGCNGTRRTSQVNYRAGASYIVSAVWGVLPSGTTC
ncbi:MAG TPA: hypothetical protein VL361_13030 [Candidatus Limnocylindrales bacterium]|nr:hypothetical protein [Candidatus Limnocylindrales bacterium]